MLKIHNSLTGKKAEFKPLRGNAVRMYVCGITVYDYIHLGHARMLTVFDLVQRYLRSRGYAVTYVRNITDIDDKIIQRAQENGEDWKALASRFITAMHEDCALLGLQVPDAEPRATEYIPEIVTMTQTLIDKGYAYRAENGDVMYSVRKFPAYGALSGRRIDEWRAGAGVRLAVRARLDAQWLRQHRRGEDVEVARQLLHGARCDGDAARSGGAAFLLARQPLSRTHQLLGGAARAGRRDAGRPVPGAQGHDAQPRGRRGIGRRPGDREISRGHGRRFQHAGGARGACRRGARVEHRQVRKRCGAHRRGGALAPRDGQSARSPAAAAGGLSQARGRRRSGDAYGCTDRGAHRRAPRGAGSQELPRVRPDT